MPPPSCIAIDGPVASGKSTVGQRLARHLGYCFLDTGSMYRAVTLAAVKGQLDLHDPSALAALAQSLDIHIELNANTGEDAVLINGCDVTAELRNAAVEQSVSLVSSYPEVRQVLVAQQRQMAQGGPMVMAGRDIGTVVLPHADLKVFLQASVAERARRRSQELAERGAPRPLQEVLEELHRRDTLDTQRTASPLRQAEDAHPIDTDDVGADGVVKRILALFAEH